MVEQILLSSGSFAGMRETGGFGQPLHALYPQIRAVLTSELGPEAAGLLAEPVVDRAKDRIDWYTEGDPDHPPVALSDLPEEQRQPMLAQVHDLLKRGREVAERYAASEEGHRAQLGAMLRAALGAPAESEIFLVEGRPVMIRWGFVPDRPWETLAEPARSPVVPPSAPGSAELPRDVAMPDIAMPELTAAAPAQEAVIETPPLTSPPPLPPPEPLPEEPLPKAAPPSLPPEPQPSTREAAPESKPTPAPGSVKSASQSEPGLDAGWRYVVVGSRYFWSVFALAVLLAVIAAFWWGIGQPSFSPASGEKSQPSPDAGLARALTQAQRTEAELRIQLENLLVQLAGRRGQCSLPAAGAPAATAPAVRELPSGSRGAASTQATVAVAAGESPREPAIKTPAADRPMVPAEEPAVTGHPAVSAKTTSAAGRPAIPTQAAAATDQPVAQAKEVPAIDRAMRSEAITPPTSIASPSSDAISSSARPASPVTSGVESSAPTLEDALTERAPASAALPAPARQQSPTQTEPIPRAEPPVKTEPTPEERREFTSRMSAAGAATGEITATLLWNSPGDLDLVVRCPSGQQLDYRNPTACGGALDVDANAARASLSNRPVENAFWPAGRAAPGTYEISVRYAPRKDEQQPQQTPFQVRLIRGGQESVFKGTIRPNTMTPVTTFTVER